MSKFNYKALDDPRWDLLSPLEKNKILLGQASIDDYELPEPVAAPAPVAPPAPIIAEQPSSGGGLGNLLYGPLVGAKALVDQNLEPLTKAIAPTVSGAAQTFSAGLGAMASGLPSAYLDSGINVQAGPLAGVELLARRMAPDSLREALKEQQVAGQEDFAQSLPGILKSAEESQKAIAALEGSPIKQWLAQSVADASASLPSIFPLAGAVGVGALTKNPAAAAAAARTLAVIPAAQAYTSAYFEAKAQGETDEFAHNYALTSSGLEYLFEAAVPGAGRTGLGTFAKRVGYEVAGESGTEGFQQVLQQAVLPESAPQSPQEALAQIGRAGSAALVMGSPVSVVDARGAAARRLEQERQVEDQQARIQAQIDADLGGVGEVGQQRDLRTEAEVRSEQLRQKADADIRALLQGQQAERDRAFDALQATPNKADEIDRAWAELNLPPELKTAAPVEPEPVRPAETTIDPMVERLRAEGKNTAMADALRQAGVTRQTGLLPAAQVQDPEAALVQTERDLIQKGLLDTDLEIARQELQAVESETDTIPERVALLEERALRRVDDAYKSGDEVQIAKAEAALDQFYKNSKAATTRRDRKAAALAKVQKAEQRIAEFNTRQQERFDLQNFYPTVTNRQTPTTTPAVTEQPAVANPQQLPATSANPKQSSPGEQQPAMTFKTAKGSVYTVSQDGTTTRDKAARSDPGHEGDSGKKRRSSKTVYVDPAIADAASLSFAGWDRGSVKNGRPRVIIRDGKASLVSWNAKEGKWGIAPSQRDIPVSDTPAVGLQPLELWDKVDDVNGLEAYSGVHAGNKITEITPATTATVDNTTTLSEPEKAQRKADLATIHQTARNMGMDETAYRGLLREVTGKDSSAKMTAPERAAVMQRMTALQQTPATEQTPEQLQAEAREEADLGRQTAAKSEKILAIREAIQADKSTRGVGIRVVTKGDTVPAEIDFDNDLGAYDPNTGNLYINADLVTPEEAPAVAMHEVAHVYDLSGQPVGRRSVDNIVGEKNRPKLVSRVQEMAQSGNPVAKAALDRAGTDQNEVLTYFIEEAKLARTQNKGIGRRASVLLQDIMAAVRGFMTDKFGTQFKIKEADIFRAAELMTREYAKGNRPATRKGGVMKSSTRESADTAPRDRGPDLFNDVSKGFDAALNAIVDKAPSEAARAIAQTIADRIRQLKTVGFVFEIEVTKEGYQISSGALGDSTLKPGALGDVTGVKVRLNHPSNGERSGTNWETVTHELAHAATQASIRYAPRGSAADKLRELFNDVIDEFNKRARSGNMSAFEKKVYSRQVNALSNQDELLAWGLTNAEFQQWLSTVQVKKRSLFDRLVDIVATALGIRKADVTALSEVIALSDEILTGDLGGYIEEANRRGASFGRQENTTGIPSWALSQADGRKILYSDGDFALIEGLSVSGNTLVVLAIKGKGITRVDIDNYTGTELPASELSRLRKIADGFRGKTASQIDQTQTTEFKRWFGDSKVVDAEGKPLVVYHGTTGDFDTFSKSTDAWLGTGFYFSETPEQASRWGSRRALGDPEKMIGKGVAEGVSVVPAYLAAKNLANYQQAQETIKSLGDNATHNAVRDALIGRGFDGVWDRSEGEIVVFSPTQIKSAIGNEGTFDPENPSIVKSRARPAANLPVKTDLPKQDVERVQPERQIGLPGKTFEGIPGAGRKPSRGTKTTDNIVRKAIDNLPRQFGNFFGSLGGQPLEVVATKETSAGLAAEATLDASQIENRYQSALMALPEKMRPEAVRNLSEASSEDKATREAARQWLADNAPAIANEYAKDRAAIQRMGLEVIDTILESGRPLTKRDVAVVKRIRETFEFYLNRAYKAFSRSAKTRKTWAKFLMDGVKEYEKTGKQNEASRIYMNGVDAIKKNYLDISGFLDATTSEKEAKKQGYSKVIGPAEMKAMADLWLGDQSPVYMAEMTPEQTDAFMERATELLKDKYKELNADGKYVDALDKKARLAAENLLGVIKDKDTIIGNLVKSIVSDKTIISKKGFVPAEIRALLGEVTNPIAQIQLTRMIQAEFLASRRTQFSLYNIGTENKWIVPADQADNEVYTQRFPDDTERYGPLAGMASTVDFINSVRPMVEASASIFDNLTYGDPMQGTFDFIKDKWTWATATTKMLSVAYNGTNAMFNLGGALLFTPLLNGNFFFFVPTPTNMKAWKFAASAVYSTLAADKRKSLTQAHRKILRAGLQDAIEVVEVQERARNTIRNNILDNVAEAMTSSRAYWTKKLGDGFGVVLKDFPVWATAESDRSLVYAMYSVEEDFLKAYYEAKGEDVPQNVIEARATERIKKGNINPARSGKAIKGLERSGVTMYMNYFLETYKSIGRAQLLGLSDMQAALKDFETGNTKAGAMLFYKGFARVAGATAMIAFNNAMLKAVKYPLAAAGILAYGLSDADDEEEKRILDAIVDMMPIEDQGKEWAIIGMREDGSMLLQDLNRFDPAEPAIQPTISLANGDYYRAYKQMLDVVIRNSVATAVWEAFLERDKDARMKFSHPNLYEAITENVVKNAGPFANEARDFVNFGLKLSRPLTPRAILNWGERYLTGPDKLIKGNEGVIDAIKGAGGYVFDTNPSRLINRAISDPKVGYDVSRDNLRKRYLEMAGTSPEQTAQVLARLVKEEREIWDRLFKAYSAGLVLSKDTAAFNKNVKERLSQDTIFRTLQLGEFKSALFTAESYKKLKADIKSNTELTDEEKTEQVEQLDLLWEVYQTVGPATKASRSTSPF